MRRSVERGGGLAVVFRRGLTPLRFLNNNLYASKLSVFVFFTVTDDLL